MLTSVKKNNRRKLEAKRRYYQRNMDEERQKSAGRTNRLRATETASQREDRRARHRQAQARYREANRLQLKTKSWQDRYDKKWQKERQHDELEYQRLMSIQDDDLCS